jgi:hypothetical protein
VNRDQAEGTWTPAHFSPVVLVGLRGTQVTVGSAIWRQLQVLLHAVQLSPAGQATGFPPVAYPAAFEYGVSALRPRPLIWIGTGCVLVDGRRRLYGVLLSVLACRRACYGTKVAIFPTSDLGWCRRRGCDAWGARDLVLA